MKLVLIVALLGVAWVQGGTLRDAAPENGLEDDPFFPEDVTYHLWTQQNPTVAHDMFIGNMNGAPFDPSKPTKVIIHGYTQDGTASFISNLKNAFLGRGDYNIIAVDWEKAASGLIYSAAAGRTKPVGQTVSDFLEYLATQGANLDTVHCLGFSLGGHVCGFAGKSMTTRKLNRITGLDPAGPSFDWAIPEERLAETDADFVDVVHTCGGLLGMMPPMGHADFYPNDGKDQPGCLWSVTGDCSHDRSHELYVESITSQALVGRLCASYNDYTNGLCASNEAAVLGEDCSRTSSGSYYLTTRGNPPFAIPEIK